MVPSKEESDDELPYVGNVPFFFEAQQRFWNVRDAYYTAVALVRQLAINSDLADTLAIQGYIRNGLREQIDHQELQSTSDFVSKFAVSQLTNDFQDYWHFAIVGRCSALEYSLKSLFIDLVKCKKLSLDRFADKSISVNAWDLASLDKEDRLSLLADKFYQDAAAKRPAFEKFKYYLSEVIACPAEEWKEAIARVDVENFNEAYLVRNCIVHHGAKVNSLLGKKAGFGIGREIVVDKKMLDGYFSAIRAMGDSLNAAANSLA